ncbi:hypothetical protein FDENT_5005 [Fusarium denticulatum]|uniref:Fido domain-containing protein n=1 Tax=Fusarium denticulatum TaxID=48507 RepID=A0A8H5UEQ0_9HYPO|nr:hypothetical protein FDENT_5005 [Fusarium denticulatum]
MAAVKTGPGAYSFMAMEMPDRFVESLSSRAGVQPNKIMEVLSRMIYGSNMILGAGGSLSTTYRICYAVFEERQIPEELAEDDFEYKEITQYMQFLNKPVSYENVMKCYRETLQHARTAKYLIARIVIERQPFDEATFKEANRLLTYNNDLSPQEPWTAHGGGNYRPWGMARDPRFLDPPQISSAMLGMINELATEMIALDRQPLKQENVQERIWNACRFCHRFILIHPFMDGNGRMYRLFLTTLLLRAGICPAVYGLYVFDRMRHWEAETSCYLQDNQALLSEAELVTFGPSQKLVNFVNQHMYCGWTSPDEHVTTFLQVTGQSTGQKPEDPAASKMYPR